MKSYEEALASILENVTALPKTRVRLGDLHGMILGEPVVATTDLPHFDNSAVDGFGVCLADVRDASEGKPVKLKLSGEVRAGDAPPATLSSGCAYKILTGATVPEGVDAVVMQECCDELESEVLIKQAPRSGQNIRRRGEEFLRGQEILTSGTRATPPVVGLLASLGQASFMACKKPVVGVITTGNELVKPGKNLGAGKIFDSNSYALLAALHGMGIDECHAFHCREDANETRKVMALALSVSDVIISAGGVSVGAHDYVKDVYNDLGIKTIVYKAAIKPGKPVFFGITGGTKKKSKKQYVFGLPGNPVSALVTFHELVKPALLKMLGDSQGSSLDGLVEADAKLLSALKKQPGRTEFVRAEIRFENGGFVAEPTSGQESHMLGGLCQANGLVVFPSEQEKLDAGAKVKVKFLRWQDA